MSILKGITAAYFFSDQEGRCVFYPWGIFGKGYIIDDLDYENKVRSSLKAYLLSLFIAICIFCAGLVFGLVYCIVLPILFVVFYWLRIHLLVKKLPVSKRELKIEEAIKKSALMHNDTTLRVCFIGSAIFLILNLGFLFLDEDGKTISLIGVIFFGICTAVSFYMIKLKKMKLP